MTEITFGEEEATKAGSSGGMEIEEVLDQLEQAEERLRNNPGLRKMLGIDLEEMTGGNQGNMTPEEANKDGPPGPSTVDEIDAEFLEEMLGGMCSAGYAEFTLEQLHSFVENNPAEVNQMLEEYK